MVASPNRAEERESMEGIVLGGVSVPWLRRHNESVVNQKLEKAGKLLCLGRFPEDFIRHSVDNHDTQRTF
jgi:hypothetical protein